MKLYELKNIIDFTFDLADNEVDAQFYIELDEINEKYAKQIEVSKIWKDCVTCKLTDFIRKHKTAIRKYLCDNYYNGEQRNYLLYNLTGTDDILSDGGEAVYHFITNDMYEFLTQ